MIPAQEFHKKDHHCPSARVYSLYLIALEYSCMFLRVMGCSNSLLNCAKQRRFLNTFCYTSESIKVMIGHDFNDDLLVVKSIIHEENTHKKQNHADLHKV